MCELTGGGALLMKAVGVSVLKRLPEEKVISEAKAHFKMCIDVLLCDWLTEVFMYLFVFSMVVFRLCVYIHRAEYGSHFVHVFLFSETEALQCFAESSPH